MQHAALRRLAAALATALIGALAIVAFSGLRQGQAPWMLDRDTLLFAVMCAAAFMIGVAVAASRLFALDGFVASRVRLLAIAALVSLPVTLLVLLLPLEIPRSTLLMAVGLVFLLLLIIGDRPQSPFALGFALILLAIGAYPSFSAPARAQFAAVFTGQSLKSDSSVQYVLTSLHDVKIVTSVVKPRPSTSDADPGGAFEPLDGSRLLLADANGSFHLLTVRPDGSITSELMSHLRAPLNRASYLRDIAVPSRDFRVTDLLLVKDDGAAFATLYLASHQWDEDEKCVTLTVNDARLDLPAMDRALHWTTRFRTAPCIPGDRTLTNETGGRLGLLPSGNLLLTVGITLADDDFWDVSIRPEASYGKIIAIDRSNWSSRIFSSGHRNPQGLLVERDQIWSTEHGPDGGDELNLIVDGGDYGWPHSSYGTDYGRKTLKGNERPGTHPSGIPPIHAWVPSIGISRLIRASGRLFPGWEGDLLLGSLAGRGLGYAIWRVRMEGDQVRFVERIKTGLRVRDIVELPDGTVVTWDGTDRVQTLNPSAHVFSKCTACHALNKGWDVSGVGPNLFGVVGRRVASSPNFQYSQPLTAFGGRWSPQRLDFYLRDPQGAVPGTTMAVPGIEDPEERREIIEFLRHASDEKTQ